LEYKTLVGISKILKQEIAAYDHDELVIEKKIAELEEEIREKKTIVIQNRIKEEDDEWLNSL